jgi:hypothetical protein
MILHGQEEVRCQSQFFLRKRSQNIPIVLDDKTRLRPLGQNVNKTQGPTGGAQWRAARAWHPDQLIFWIVKQQSMK